MGIVLAYWFDNWTDRGALQCHEECTKNEWKWAAAGVGQMRCLCETAGEGPAASSIQVAV